jgi:hypothetical protein
VLRPWRRPTSAASTTGVSVVDGAGRWSPCTRGEDDSKASRDFESLLF